MKFYFAYKQRKQTCCWFLPNLYKTEFGFQIFFYKHLLSAQQEMHSFSYLYFYRKQSQSKVWVGVDLLEKILHRWAWQTGTPKIICTRNEQELPFKNESKLPLIFEQRNIVSVKYVMCYSLRQISADRKPLLMAGLQTLCVRSGVSVVWLAAPWYTFQPLETNNN